MLITKHEMSSGNVDTCGSSYFCVSSVAEEWGGGDGGVCLRGKGDGRARSRMWGMCLTRGRHWGGRR